jgi:hypothetical protein
MRVEPSLKIKKRNEVPFHIRIENITRILAIIVAFLSTFFFFLKILYF